MKSTGTLFVVATPIGNLEDITLRALRILKEADYIAAEDTRHTKKLLNHFSISTPLISYYREREQQRSAELIYKLQDGKDIALVSDAGTPAISDPGAVLVQAALESQLKVVPIPGPSAVTAAVSCAGISDGMFLFLGFPPSKSGQRKTFLQNISGTSYPVVVYESPRRIEKLVADIMTVLGNRQLSFARELTKSYEEIQRTTTNFLLDQLQKQPVKGEIVLIIFPADSVEVTDEKIVERIEFYSSSQTLKTKELSQKIAEELGIHRSRVYQLALEYKKHDNR